MQCTLNWNDVNRRMMECKAHYRTHPILTPDYFKRCIIFRWSLLIDFHDLDSREYCFLRLQKKTPVLVCCVVSTVTMNGTEEIVEENYTIGLLRTLQCQEKLILT